MSSLKYLTVHVYPQTIPDVIAENLPSHRKFDVFGPCQIRWLTDGMFDAFVTRNGHLEKNLHGKSCIQKHGQAQVNVFFLYSRP